MKVDPHNHWIRIGRGMMYAMSGEREKAVDELRDLMKEEAESHRLHAQVWIGTALGGIDGSVRGSHEGSRTSLLVGTDQVRPPL